MNSPLTTVSDFLRYRAEFGVGAAFRVFFNNWWGGPVKSLRVKGYQHPFFYRHGTTDMRILRFIIGRQLLYKPSFTPKLIIDGGANVGYVSVYYANRFPDAEVYSVEMEATNYEMLLKNSSGYPNVKPVKAALWNHSNGVSFSSSADVDSHSILSNRPPDQTAKSVTLSNILEMSKSKTIDVLKLDIEGAEVEILDWMRAADLQPRALMVELHDRFRPGCSEALENYLRGRSFVRSMIDEYEVIEFS